jgi:hypothetical protein
MKLGARWKKLMRLGLVGSCLWLCSITSSAQVMDQSTGKGPGQTTDVTGQYECTEARVAGKSVPCKVAQLSLKSDGRFELQGREGQ